MESLPIEMDIGTLADVYWDNPVSGVLPSYFPGLAREWREPEKMPGGREHEFGGEAAVQPRLCLLFQGTGSARLMLAGAEVHLDAGDLALYVEPDATARLPLLPGQDGWPFALGELAATRHEILMHLPTVLPRDNPATALLVHYSAGLAGAGPDLPATLRKQFLDRLLGMVADTLASLREAGEELPRLARFHLHRIKAYLRVHLREPDLTVKKLALDLALSVSHVHRVFAHEGGTVADWFWGERLEGCAADLSNPAEAHRTVGEIALSWGFNDLSHFSHAFRKRFGMPPKEWRNRAPWRQPLREGRA